jgi:hypothetical protein
MRAVARPLVFATLLLVLAPAAFAANHWTSVASTGAIDGSSLSFFSFAGPTLTYLPGSTSLLPVIARYNVTNTYDNNANPEMPGWTTFQLGYSAVGLPAGAVSATLFQVDPCTGNQVVICTVNSLSGVSNVCGDCTFLSTTFNFAAHLYYIQVTLTRHASNLFPTAKTLQIF